MEDFLVLCLNRTGDRRITFENLHILLHKTSCLCQNLSRKGYKLQKAVAKVESYLRRWITHMKDSGHIWNAELIKKYTSNYPQPLCPLHWFYKESGTIFSSFILKTKFPVLLQRLNPTHNPIEMDRCCSYSNLTQTECETQ